MEQEYVGVERRKSGWKKYRNIGFTAFLVIAAAVVVVFVFYKFETVKSVFGTITSVLAPLLLGILFAYIMNPMMCFFERHIGGFLGRHMRKKARAAKISRVIGIMLSLAVVISIITLLVYLIAPEIKNTVTRIIDEAPTQIEQFLKWFNGLSNSTGKFADAVKTVVNKATEYAEDLIENDLADYTKEVIEYVASGVIDAVGILYDILIGFVFSIYILAKKEKFAGQFKKIMYSIIKPAKANYIVTVARQCHAIFSGAITGKILDSAIIGVLCFVGMTVIEIPYAMLVSVFVGVTNVIPFFGPFIGAIPSALLILFVDPWACLWFIIFIICLQQFDCNILDPRIVGGSIGLDAFYVLFACVFFGGMFGIIGLLLGVPTFACLYLIVKKMVEDKLKRRGMITKTEDFSSLDLMDLEQFNRPAEQNFGRRATDMKDGKPYGRRATDYPQGIPGQGASGTVNIVHEYRPAGGYVSLPYDPVEEERRTEDRRAERTDKEILAKLDRYLIDDDDRKGNAYTAPSKKKKGRRKQGKR